MDRLIAEFTLGDRLTARGRRLEKGKVRLNTGRSREKRKRISGRKKYENERKGRKTPVFESQAGGSLAVAPRPGAHGLGCVPTAVSTRPGAGR